MTVRTITILNFIVIAWFLFLYLAYQFNVNSGVLQFVAELITIPLFLGQYILLYVGFRKWRATGMKTFSKVSIILLLISSVLTTVSFFL